MSHATSKHRSLSLQRLGILPSRPFRGALRPGVTGVQALTAAIFVLLVTAILDYGALLDLFRGRPAAGSLEAIGGTLLVVGAVGAVAIAYLGRYGQRKTGTWQQRVVFAACCLLCVAMAKLLAWLDGTAAPGWRSLVYLTPLAGFSVFLAVVYDQFAAIIATLVLAVLVGLAAKMSPGGSPIAAEALPVVIVLLCGALVAIYATRSIRKRLKLFHVGVLVALVHTVLLAGFALIRGELNFQGPPPVVLLWGAVNGIGVGILLTLALPLIEILFDVATDIRLLELTDQNQPLLRHQVARAPSTDNHARRVALLAEAAAEAIGANGLLALVGSYYHDIGKMAKPEYFIENQTGSGESPHDRLRPSMSALIIAAHAKDGVELAEDAGLPRAIIDIIAQHHGTSTMEFFLNRYLEEAGEKPQLDASFFRYPGPRPATKEAAIVMLADAVEAASRTLVAPLPSRIDTLIKKITTAKLLDGQFEECRLTLSELTLIEHSFFRILCSMYHARIDYPTAPTDRIAARARGLRGAASAAL